MVYKGNIGDILGPDRGLISDTNALNQYIAQNILDYKKLGPKLADFISEGGVVVVSHTYGMKASKDEKGLRSTYGVQTQNVKRLAKDISKNIGHDVEFHTDRMEVSPSRGLTSMVGDDVDVTLDEIVGLVEPGSLVYISEDHARNYGQLKTALQAKGYDFVHISQLMPMVLGDVVKDLRVRNGIVDFSDVKAPFDYLLVGALKGPQAKVRVRSVKDGRVYVAVNEDELVAIKKELDVVSKELNGILSGKDLRFAESKSVDYWKGRVNGLVTRYEKLEAQLEALQEDRDENYVRKTIHVPVLAERDSVVEERDRLLEDIKDLRKNRVRRETYNGVVAENKELVEKISDLLKIHADLKLDRRKNYVTRRTHEERLDERDNAILELESKLERLSVPVDEITPEKVREAILSGGDYALLEMFKRDNELLGLLGDDYWKRDDVKAKVIGLVREKVIVVPGSYSVEDLVTDETERDTFLRELRSGLELQERRKMTVASVQDDYKLNLDNVINLFAGFALTFSELAEEDATVEKIKGAMKKHIVDKGNYPIFKPTFDAIIEELGIKINEEGSVTW